jgi:hypothetical protein
MGRRDRLVYRGKILLQHRLVLLGCGFGIVVISISHFSTG